MIENSYAQPPAAGTSLLPEEVPGTATERAIAEVWAEVLNLDEIGRHDNFFDLGGHSVLATQAVARMSVALGRSVPERALFDWPTVAGLASAVPGYPATGADGPVLVSSRRSRAGA